MNMPEIKGPKEIRDHHSSNQWVYFAEEIKQRISYFLSDKLFGKNLELGGGWYLTHPNSTVVDVSPKSLEYNPAKEKVEFNLDDINEGKKLPFPDNSFDHATMVSVYQYLEGGDIFRNELMRVLKPGAELYIINLNGGGSGLSDSIVKNSTHISSIQNEFQQAGFETLVENIPFREDIKDVQSLCVAMPDIDLFGPNNGQIRDKDIRERINEIYSRYKPLRYYSSGYKHDDYSDLNEIMRSTDYFTPMYSKWELKKMNDLLYKIATYPVTVFSAEYQKDIETFTQECLEKTDCVPIFTSHITTEIALDMAAKPSDIRPTLHILGKTGKADNDQSHLVKQIADKYDINESYGIGSFPGNTIDEVINYYTTQDQKTQWDHYGYSPRERRIGLNEIDQNKIINFLAEIPLNSVTKDFQERLRALAKSRADRDEPGFVRKDQERIEERKDDMKEWQEYQKRKAAGAMTEEDEDHIRMKPDRPEPYTRPWYCILDQLIDKKRARSYYNLLTAYKQRRPVEKLLKIKEEYANGEKEPLGWKQIDYLSYIPLFPEFFDNNDADANRGYHAMPDW